MKKQIKHLVIHCTATREGQELTKADFDRMHLAPKPVGNGWKQYGYRKVVRLDGSWLVLVPDNGDQWVDPREISNGVGGINSITESICYTGGVDKNLKIKDTRTAAQKLALEKEVKETIAKFPWIKVAGHYQFDSKKACPSFNVPQWLKSIGVEAKNIYIP